MKKFLMFLLVVLFAAAPAEATLINVFEDVVYDDVNNRYWFSTLDGTFSGWSWEEQLARAEALNGVPPGEPNPWSVYDFGLPYYGLTDWHVANLAEMEKLWEYEAAEIFHSFGYTEFAADSIEGNSVWVIGRYATPDNLVGTAHAALIHMEEYEKTPLVSTGRDPSLATAQDSIGAWVTSGPAPVPEPATLLLLGAGLIGIAGFRKFRRTAR